MSKTRIYKVKSQQREWLIRATTRSQAITYVAGHEIEARVATQEDIVNALENGMRVERAKQDGDEQ